MRHTGRLLTPWMPERSSTVSALPPQPSWRIFSMMSRIRMVALWEVASVNIRSCPHRSQVTRMNQLGNAANGSSRASAPVGRGIVAVAAPVALRGRPAHPGRSSVSARVSCRGWLRWQATRSLCPPAFGLRRPATERFLPSDRLDHRSTVPTGDDHSAPGRLRASIGAGDGGGLYWATNQLRPASALRRPGDLPATVAILSGTPADRRYVKSRGAPNNAADSS